MNKIHLTIWNASLGSWIAVSEISGFSRAKTIRKTTNNSFIKIFALSFSYLLIENNLYACTPNSYEQIVANKNTVTCSNNQDYTWTENNNGYYAINSGQLNINGNLKLDSSSTLSLEYGGGAIYAEKSGSSINIDGYIDVTRRLPSPTGSVGGIVAFNGGEINIIGDDTLGAPNAKHSFGGFTASSNANGFTGINSFGNNSKLFIKGDLDIEFVGGLVGSAAFLAERGTGNVLTIDGKLNIETEGSIAIYADSRGTVNAKEVTIRVGMDDLDKDGKIRDLANNLNYGAIYANENGKIEIEGGSVASAAKNVLFANQNGQINASGNLNITLHSKGYSGALASGANSQIKLNTSTVSVKAESGIGFKVENRGTIKTDGDVTIQSAVIENSCGDNGILPGGGVNSCGGVVGDMAGNVTGVFASTNSSITIGGKLNSNTTGTGVYANGLNSLVALNGTNNSADITVSDADKFGLYATARSKITSAADVKVTGQNTGIIGVKVDGASTITLGGKLTTSTHAVGAYATGTESKLTAASADITTAAMTGIKADLAGVVNITGDAEVLTNANGTLVASLLDTAMRNVTADGSGSQVNIGGTLDTKTAGIGALASNSGQISIGNAKITVETPLATTAGVVSGIALQATTAGTVALGTADIDVNVENGLGLHATGSGSKITSTGGVEVAGTKAGVIGAKAEAQGGITLGGKLTTSTQAVGAYATGTGSKLTAASADITTAAMTGLKADLAGVVNITGDAKVVANAKINADGTLGASLLDTAMRNVTADGGGSQVNIGGTLDTQTAGIGALASNSGQINIGQALITVLTPVTGTTPGKGVQATTKGSVTVMGGTIDIQMDSGIGAQAIAAGKVQMKGATINVDADNAIGMQAKDQSSVATIQSGTINVDGNNGRGIQALDNGLAEAAGGTINVNVSTGIGAQAIAAGKVQLSGGMIKVTAANAIGMQAENQSSVATMKSGTIQVSGANSVAAQSKSKGQLEIQGGVIQLDGSNGAGLQALTDSSINFSNANVTINLNGTDNTALNTCGIDTNSTCGVQAQITGNGNVTVDGAGGQGSRAVWARANSSIDFTSGLFTSTTQGTGVQADGQDALVSLSRANITSTKSSGLHAVNSGNIHITDTAQITSQADDQPAALVEKGGRLTGQVLDLITEGKNAAGLAVMSPTSTVSTAPDAELAAVRVRTSGTGSDGIRVGNTTNSGNVKVTGGVDITITGTPATGSGCDVGAGICMTSDNSKFELEGANTSQIQSGGYGLRMASGNDMSMSLTNAKVSVTGSSAVIDFNGVGGGTILSLNNSQINSTATDSLISIDASSAATLQSKGSTLYGMVSAVPSSAFKMNLTQKSYMLGTFDGVANLNIDNSSVWEVASDSYLYKIENAGTIDFTENYARTNVYRKVIVDGYKGNGGSLYLDTFLENDQSSSDQLVIRKNPSPNPSNNPAFELNTNYSGQAIGTTYIYVTNRGGLGAYSTGKGIKVVDADTDPNASTTVDAFVQGHQISAGAYDYTLYRNADESWYLFSSQNQKDPDYSDESSATTVLGPLAQLYGAATLGSWRERMGGMAYADLTQANQQRSTAAPLWVRMEAGKGKHMGGKQYKATPTSVTYSPDYDHDITFLQMGGDLYQHFDKKGSQYVAGAYFTTGSIHGDVHTYDELTAVRRSNAARASLDNISLGGYWTMVTSNGSYVDIVGQYTEHDLTVQGASSPQTGHGHSWQASVEAGKALPVNSSWTLVPQAQMHMQNVRLQPMTAIESQNSVGVYRFDNNNSLQARLGLEARYQTKPLNNAWLRFDVLHEFKGNYTASYKPEQTSSERPQFTSTRKGTSVALLAGMELELDKNVAMYGTAGYQRGITHKKDHAWNMQLGMRWGF